MKRFPFTQGLVLASIGLILTVVLAACGGGSPSLSAQFTGSRTAVAPGLVKLVEKSRSGSLVVVDVVLFGPEPNIDLDALHFGVKNGNSALVQFVPQANFTQTALVADVGQTIAIDVDSTSDPSLVQVNAEKQGGGAGNGIAGASAVVIELVFNVKASGSATLTLTGLGNNLPVATDSARNPIATVTFDAASGSVMGVSSGGGGY